MMFSGDVRAVAEARAALAAAATLAGAGVAEASLHRIIGVASWHAGEYADAEKALHASLDGARHFGAAYEEALTLHVLGQLVGDQQAASAAAEIFQRLGVVEVRALPLSAP